MIDEVHYADYRLEDVTRSVEEYQTLSGFATIADQEFWGYFDVNKNEGPRVAEIENQKGLVSAICAYNGIDESIPTTGRSTLIRWVNGCHKVGRGWIEMPDHIINPMQSFLGLICPEACRFPKPLKSDHLWQAALLLPRTHAIWECPGGPEAR